jgi:Fe2+ transport system protein FeoA
LISVLETSTVAAPSSLARLSVGDTAVVRRVSGRRTVVRRLLEMGLVPGTAVTLRRVAPLGDPIELHVRNYALSIRRDEAGGIEVD